MGTFQYFLAKNDIEGLRTLADYAISRHYRDAKQTASPYRALLTDVVLRHAELVAQWMLLGFIHGVMNTDNTSISGETIDYGPCAFMESFDPNCVFSSIDRQGRYAYSNQPRAAQWNLTRFAETLLPLLQQEAGTQEAALAWAYEALEAFGPHFEQAHLAGMRRKLGLTTQQEGDATLAQDLLNRMAANEADFTVTFRRLSEADVSLEGDAKTRTLFTTSAAFNEWATQWRRRLAEESMSPQKRTSLMQKANPLFIPRNHLVEAAITAAVERQDFQPFEHLLGVILRPYDDRPDQDLYAIPARAEERVTATFCGT